MISVGWTEKNLVKWSKFSLIKNKEKMLHNRLAIQITNTNKCFAGKLNVSVGFIKPRVRSSLQVK